MIQRCILVAAFFSLISCKKSFDKDALPLLLELDILDSALVEEKDFFINGQYNVELVGDSLIAVSSFKSPSVGIYHISGKQQKRIASGDFPIGSFLPSNFDASEYPVIYILDQKSESILVFNVEDQEFLKKIKLALPEGKRIKMLGSKFKKLKGGYLIELVSSLNNNFNPDYYRKSGKLIYLFNDDGEVKENPFLEYPNEIKEIEGSLKAIDYLNFSSTKNSLLFSFPHERKIRRYEIHQFGKLLDEIPLPNSRYFDYHLKGADGIVFYAGPSTLNEQKFSVPTNDNFSKILESSGKIVIQTWLVGDESQGLNRTSHLMIYDKEKEEWSETSNPKNILDIGMLAGVVNDTLYFYEGSLMKHDEKYIKRAVLRLIEE